MSLPRYPEYKDSEVEWLGEVPAHWTVDALRRRASLNPSKSEVNELPDDALVSFLPMEAVGERGELDLSRTRPISDVLSGYTYFREGDVTFAKITPCFENGKGARMVGLHGGCGFGTTELTVARPNSDLLDSHYLDWVFRSTPFRKRGEAAMYGAGGQKRVPDEFVRQFVFGWPDVEEQISIARFIDRETARIDALIAEQETLLALLAEKRQATISHAVTRGLDPHAPMKDSGIAWLGEVPAHWEFTTLGKTSIDRCDGPFGSGIKSDHYTEEGAFVVRLQNIRAGEFRMGEPVFLDLKYFQASLKGHEVRAGDLLVAGLGDDNNLLGRACVAPAGLGPALVKADCFRFRLHHEIAVASFVAMQLSTGAAFDAGHMATGTTRARMPLGVMAARRLALPPVSEQAKIAAFLEEAIRRFDALGAEAMRGVELLKERRSALISAAVIGQIDVRGLVNEATA